MPAGRPRTLDPQQATAAIVESFWAGGYQGTNLDDIAARLGVGKPTLYRTFGNKAAAFAAALDAYFTQHFEPIIALLDRPGPAAPAIDAMFDALCQKALDANLPNGCLLGDAAVSARSEGSVHVDRVAHLQERLALALTAWAERARRQGEIATSANPAAVAAYLLGQVVAIAALSRQHPTRDQLTAITALMFHALPWADPRPSLRTGAPMNTSHPEPTGDPDPTDDQDHVTLFKGAAANSYFALYFNAEPSPGAEQVAHETHAIDLRPERDVTLHVEIFNPTGTLPLVVTPGGMGDCEGFRSFARNVAAADPDLRVVIWDRRNMGQSDIAFGDTPLSLEEADDLHFLIDRLGIAPAALYTMSSGARSNLVLAERHPEDVAALVIAPLTGGPIASEQLPEEYYLKYIGDDSITSMEALAATPFWAAYVERNGPEQRERFFGGDVAEFLAAMQRSGEHLRSFRHTTALGMTDEQLAALRIPATLILHHGDETDELHPIPNSRAATTLIENSRFEIAPTLEPVLERILPFIRDHTPALP